VKGTSEPEYVNIYGYYCRAETYVFPPRYCKKCHRIGHKEAACKVKTPKCFYCNKDKHEEEGQCELRDKPVCINCGGNHISTFRDCPEKIRQSIIQNDMTVNRLSYQESAAKYPKYKRAPEITSEKEFPPLDPTQVLKDFNRTNINYKKSDYRTITRRINLEKKKKDRPTIKFNTFPIADVDYGTTHPVENNPYKSSEYERLLTTLNQQVKILSDILAKAEGDDNNQYQVLQNISENIGILTRTINPEHGNRI
jgi:hypothetical protein